MINGLLNSMQYITFGFENCTEKTISLKNIVSINLEKVTRDIYFSEGKFKDRWNVRELYIVLKSEMSDIYEESILERLFDYSDVCYIYFGDQKEISNNSNESEKYHINWDSVHCTADNRNQMSGYSAYDGNLHLIIGTSKINEEVFYLNGCEVNQDKKSNDFVSIVFEEEMENLQ